MTDKRKQNEIVMFDASELANWGDKTEAEKDAIIEKMAERLKANFISPEQPPAE